MLRIVAPEETAVGLLNGIFLKGNPSDGTREVGLAVEDAFKRLMAPSIENEVRLITKEKADVEAIKTFQTNLRQLLMAPPLGNQMVMAVDPGVRTGCKLAVLNPQGKFLEYQTIFIGQGQQKEREAAETIPRLCKKHAIEVIAIGNGTASRETETFIRNLNIPDVKIIMVNESGASYYSASDVARREFPERRPAAWMKWRSCPSATG